MNNLLDLDRLQWPECEWCKHYGFDHMLLDGWEYCPFCGKPFTEDAWAELERKIGVVATPPDNPPLTLEELREMGEDWVWIKLLLPLYHMDSGYYIKKSKFSSTERFGCGYPDLVVRELLYSGYGDFWLAYHRKPEEGT